MKPTQQMDIPDWNRLWGRYDWCILLLILPMGSFLRAQELAWPTKHGPYHNGMVPTNAGTVPKHWQEATGENIAWKIQLEGEGHSSPVIGQGNVWLTSATADGTKQYLYQIDADQGTIVKHLLLFENAEPEPLGNKINTYASPSCILTTDAIFVHFGCYGTAKIDSRRGQVIWRRRDLECRHFRGPGSSPVLADGLLVLTFDGIDQQYLVGLDADTGATVWRTDRSTNFRDTGPDGKPQGDGDFRKAYATPGIVEVAGQKQVVSVGSKAAFGYDLQTGQEIWTIEHDSYNAAATPLFLPGWAFLNTGSRNAVLIGLRLDESTRGHVTQSHIVWARRQRNSDMSSPLLLDNRLYMVANNGVVSCVSATTGAEIWAGRLSGTFTASPIAADGLIYFCSDQGTTHLVPVGETFTVLATNTINDGIRANPAVADGALYIRSFQHLYKIQNLGTNSKRD